MSSFRGINPKRGQQIADLAEFLADDYFCDKRVEPLELVQEKGITYSFGDYESAFDGLLEYRSGRFHIFANIARLGSKESPRARFTIGHELGHYFIDSHRIALKEGLLEPHPSFCEYESNWEIEKEADHFASNLLMPSRRFAKKVGEAELGLKGIQVLADSFGTSITATSLRYVKEEIVPCALFKWNPDGTLQWKYLSTQTFRAKFRSSIEAIADLPEDSPTAEVLKSTEKEENYSCAGTTAATWFRYVSDGSARNSIFIEEAMKLGRYGLLSFIYPEAGQYS